MSNNIGIYQLGFLIVAELKELFKGCVFIEGIEYDRGNEAIVISCTDRYKMSILENILKPDLGQGDISNLKYIFKYTGKAAVTPAEIEKLFEDSARFSRIITTDPPLPPMTFIGFKKEVIQYDSDDFSKPTGKTTTLSEMLAEKYLITTYPIFTEDN